MQYSLEHAAKLQVRSIPFCGEISETMEIPGFIELQVTCPSSLLIYWTVMSHVAPSIESTTPG